MTTITAILSLYGFQTRANDTMFWGTGSLVWGHTATVKATGRDTYRVTVEHWEYDQYGEPVYESTETRTLYGAQALAWVFAEMPQSFWRRR